MISFNNTIKNYISATLVTVSLYIFLLIERPWESFSALQGMPIERAFAGLMIIVALLGNKIKIVNSSTNKWVYSLLLLHFILIPFSFNGEFTIIQNYEYAKAVLVYMLMLSVVDDESSLKILLRVFIFSLMFYMLHSLWEYYNGRHVWRMGIARMIGVDETHNDPNSFGASVVLSLPFVYALLRSETKPLVRKLYFCYFLLSILCVVLTGSRSASVAFVFLLLFWGFAQKGGKKMGLLILVLIALGSVWTVMPQEKQERIRTLWDKDAGPENAHGSARGRLVGWKVSWEMFKQKPLTGVGPGGRNFIGYRMAHNIDDIVGSVPSSTQSHNLYGQVLAEFGLPGALFFVGLIFATWQNSRKALCMLTTHSQEESIFLCSVARAIIICLFLLLLLGIAGHNFYRQLWLWLAAWSGSLVFLAETKFVCHPDGVTSSTQPLRSPPLL